MFKLNLSKILPDFSLRKEKTDQFIHTWRNQNKAVYADFKKESARCQKAISPHCITCMS